LVGALPLLLILPAWSMTGEDYPAVKIGDRAAHHVYADVVTFIEESAATSRDYGKHVNFKPIEDSKMNKLQTKNLNEDGVSQDTNENYAGTSFVATINNSDEATMTNSTGKFTSDIVSHDTSNSYNITNSNDSLGDIAHPSGNTNAVAPVVTPEVVPEKGADKIGVDTLDALLGLVEKVTFESLYGEKMKPKDYYIQSIEELHNLALVHGFDIGLQNDSPHVYNGRYWERFGDVVFRHFLEAVAIKQEMPLNIAKDHKFVDNLEKQFQSAGRFPVPPKSSMPKLNLRNGTLYFTASGIEFKPCFNKMDGIMYQLDYDYDPAAVAPQFDKFIDEVQPDAGIQKLLFQYVGYVFLRHMKLEKILILYGDGENGKSVLLDVIVGLVGEQQCCPFGLEGLTDKSGYQRAQLGDYLLNVCTDISDKMKIDVFKRIASREPLDARNPYGRPFRIAEYATSIFSANKLPQIAELTGGAFRRILPVPFSVKIANDNQDPQLAKKIIESEMSGVLNYVIAGMKSLMAEGNFDIPEAVHQAAAEFILESDSVLRFLKENCFCSDENNRILLPEMYETYRAFCDGECCKPVEKIAFALTAGSDTIENSKIVRIRVPI
jgi:putative DNA primase/helicase